MFLRLVHRRRFLIVLLVECFCLGGGDFGAEGNTIDQGLLRVNVVDDMAFLGQHLVAGERHSKASSIQKLGLVSLRRLMSNPAEITALIQGRVEAEGLEEAIRERLQKACGRPLADACVTRRLDDVRLAGGVDVPDGDFAGAVADGGGEGDVVGKADAEGVAARGAEGEATARVAARGEGAGNRRR